MRADYRKLRATRSGWALWTYLLHDIVTSAPARHWDALKARRNRREAKTRMERPSPIGSFLEVLGRDIRYAVRALRRTPTFAIAAITSLSVGIGANATMFSVVNGLLLKPLYPLPQSDRLVLVHGRSVTDAQWSQLPVSYPDFVDWRRQSRTIEGLAAYSTQRSNLIDRNGPEQFLVARVTAGFFPTLGVAPAIGRWPVDQEDRAGVSHVVVLSHAVWQRRFGGNPAAIGSSIVLDGGRHDIVGVMPPAFWFPSEEVDLWMPAGLEGTGDRTQFLQVVGRLRGGRTIEQARQDMDRVADDLERMYPVANKGLGTSVVPLREELVGKLQAALLILAGAAGLVLLIVCANVANLWLARANARKREFALRVALGASNSRLARQLLTEALVVSLAGAAGGLAMAIGGLKFLVTLDLTNFPHLNDAVSIDATVFVFTAAVAIGTALLFGLAPALQVRRNEPQDWLGDGGRGSTGHGRRLLPASLVIGEIAVAVILLVGAGLLVKSYGRLMSVDAGFVADHVLTMSVNLPDLKYRERWQRSQFYTDAIARLQGLPGVAAAGATSVLPLSGVARTEFRVAPAGERRFASYRIVTPAYFRAAGMTLITGRPLSIEDGAESPKAIVVNKTLAREFFGKDGRPVGSHLLFDDTPLEIVGVAADVRHYALEKPAEPELYLSYLQNPVAGMQFAIRTTGAPLALAAAARQAIRSVDADLPVTRVETLDNLVLSRVASRRADMELMGVFSAVALFLALVGVYSLIAYGVTQQRREIGVRVALGARPGSVTRMIVQKGVRLALVGILLGISGAVAVSRLLTSVLFEVSATDVATLAGACAVIGLTAALASYLPARRAAQTQPLDALRGD
jgi:putative ABC transport system permease protein